MIRKAQDRDLPELTDLALMCWPNHSREEMLADLTDIFYKDDAAFFLAFKDDCPIGFAQCQLRHDYVEGTETTPVGYLEGIYVVRQHRGKGIARALLSFCENWAKVKGCTEFASDCELSNTQSLEFHLHVGFAEENRIICFAKKL